MVWNWLSLDRFYPLSKTCSNCGGRAADSDRKSKGRSMQRPYTLKCHNQ
ncbi:MAG: hypothetical protein F6K22_35180 [Okeania sp. SIO2F4]|nr:hypothetical protein [Okeania sp. SIO2F4]NES07569.1 hypothetical protein [Okeania sp. SIO2F4]